MKKETIKKLKMTFVILIAVVAVVLIAGVLTKIFPDDEETINKGIVAAIVALITTFITKILPVWMQDVNEDKSMNPVRIEVPPVSSNLNAQVEYLYKELSNRKSILEGINGRLKGLRIILFLVLFLGLSHLLINFIVPDWYLSLYDFHYYLITLAISYILVSCFGGIYAFSHMSFKFLKYLQIIFIASILITIITASVEATYIFPSAKIKEALDGGSIQEILDVLAIRYLLVKLLFAPAAATIGFFAGTLLGRMLGAPRTAEINFEPPVISPAN
jgi:hypothetical protein